MKNQENQIIIEMKDKFNTVLNLSFSDNFFSDVDNFPLKKFNEDKKFNLKINKDDIILLDEIAKANDVPRSQIINFILHQILKDQFSVFKNQDAKLLFALKADEIKSSSYSDNSWVMDALENSIDFLVNNIYEYNSYYEAQEKFNSDEFKILKSKIEGLK